MRCSWACAVLLIISACGVSPSSSPGLLRLAGSETADISTDASQCTSAIDLLANGDRVLLLGGAFDQAHGGKTYHVRFTIRPFAGVKTYPASNPATGGGRVGDVEPRQLADGATLSLRVQPQSSAAPQDWESVSGAVKVEELRLDTASGSIAAALKRVSSGGAATTSGTVTLSGSWHCHYLIDPLRHF